SVSGDVCISIAASSDPAGATSTATAASGVSIGSICSSCCCGGCGSACGGGCSSGGGGIAAAGSDCAAAASFGLLSSRLHSAMPATIATGNPTSANTTRQ